jgi:hypothetical protein
MPAAPIYFTKHINTFGYPSLLKFFQLFFSFKFRHTPFSSEFTRTSQTIRFVKILKISTESIFQVLFRYYKCWLKCGFARDKPFLPLGPFRALPHSRSALSFGFAGVAGAGWALPHSAALSRCDSAALRRTPPHSAALRRTPPHSAALRRTPPHSAALSRTSSIIA